MAVRKTLCQVDSVPDGGAIAIDFTDGNEARALIVLRRGEQVRAYENICPHAGRRLDWAPGRFLIEDGVLICASHGAIFTIPDGECVGGPCRGASLCAVRTEIVDGGVDLA